MREKKFKAWDKHKKVFIPNDVWAFVTTDFGAFGIMLKDWENYKEGEYFYENSQELVEFTGLHDRSGKEVFEGDVCKVFIETGGISDRKSGFMYGVVEYKKNEYHINPFRYNGDIKSVFGLNKIYGFLVYGFTHLENIEVIGNIYENPELL